MISVADRAGLAIILGSLILLVSTVLGWSAVPSSLGTVIAENGELLFDDTHLTIEWLYKLVAAAIAISSLLLLFLRPQWIPNLLKPVILAVFFFLSLPFFIQHSTPDMYSDSQLIYFQMSRVVDILEKTMDQQQNDWRKWQRLDKLEFSRGLPVNMGQYDTLVNSKTFWMMSVAGFSRIYGVTNEVLAFITRGWVIGLAGVLIILIGIFSVSSGSGRRSGFPALFSLAILSIMAIFALPSILGAIFASSAEDNLYRGLKHDAKRDYDIARMMLPTLNYDISFVSKLYAIEDAVGCDDCSGVLLSSVYSDITGKNFASAIKKLDYLSDKGETGGGFRYWASFVYQELAFETFREGQYSQAKWLLEKSLEFVSIDPMSWYGLYLVGYQLDDYQLASLAIRQVYRLQQYLGFKSLAVKGQNELAVSWLAYKAGRLDAAHESFRRYISP